MTENTPSLSVQRLQQYDRIYVAHHQAIVDWLAVAPGSRVLDAGCGTGSTTAMFASAVGPQGRVAALDANPEHVAATREALAATPHAERATYHECSLLDMPFAAGEFDLVWCSRVVHHLPDQLEAVRALRRVVKPGGRLVLREGGLSAHFLPFDLGVGAPGLEARLQVVQDRWFAQHVRNETGAHVTYPFGWLQLLRDAGLQGITARSFLFEAVPLSPELMEYGLSQLRTRLTNAEVSALLTTEDKQTIEALLDAEGPHYLARRADLHWLSVSSLYIGVAV